MVRLPAVLTVAVPLVLNRRELIVMAAGAEVPLGASTSAVPAKAELKLVRPVIAVDVPCTVEPTAQVVPPTAA